MSARQATVQDLPALVELGREMQAEAPALRHVAYDGAKVREYLKTAIEAGPVFVHETGGVIDGAFVGLVVKRWFSAAEMATDLALFVRSGRRGGLIAFELVDMFLAWCEDNGIDDVQVGVTTGLAPEQAGRFYERLGFQFIGGNYQKRLNGHKENDHLHRS